MVDIVSRTARAPRRVAHSTGAREVTERHASNGAALTVGTGAPSRSRTCYETDLPNAAGTPPEEPSRRTSRSLMLTLLDTLSVTLALILANHLLVHGAVINLPGGTRLTYPQLSVLLGTGWIITLEACRVDVRQPQGFWRTEGRCMARAAFIVLGALCMAAVVLPLDVDRPFVAAVFVGGLLLQLVSRVLLRRAAVRRLDASIRTAGPRTGATAVNSGVHG